MATEALTIARGRRRKLHLFPCPRGLPGDNATTVSSTSRSGVSGPELFRNHALPAPRRDYPWAGINLTIET